MTDKKEIIKEGSTIEESKLEFGKDDKKPKKIGWFSDPKMEIEY